MAGTESEPSIGGFLRTGRLWEGSELAALKSFFNAKENADSMRRKEAEARLNYLEDDWKPYLLRKLSEIYNTENAREIRKLADTSNNPSKRIIDELSTIYDEPPTWAFGELVTPEQREQWGEILETASHEVQLPENNRIVNACNESAIWVTLDETRTALSFQVIDPSRIIAWQFPNNPTKPWALMIFMGMVDSTGGKPYWLYMSADPMDPNRSNFHRRDLDGREIPGTRIPNPYRDDLGLPVLPVEIYHRRAPRGRLWDRTSGNDLFELTLLLGVLESAINHLVRTDSHAQKYVSGKLSSSSSVRAGTLDVLSFQSHDGSPIAIGQFLSQSNWDGLGGITTRKLQNVLNNHGMSLGDFRLEGSPASGFALRVRKERVVEQRRRQIPLFRTHDRNLYRIVQAVWNFELTNSESAVDGLELPPRSIAKPDPKYAPYQQPLTVQERQTEHALTLERIRLGLDNPVDVLMRENPGMSREDAESRLLENVEITRRVGFRALVPNAKINQANAVGSLAGAVAEQLAAKREQQRTNQTQDNSTDETDENDDAQ